VRHVSTEDEVGRRSEACERLGLGLLGHEVKRSGDLVAVTCVYHHHYHQQRDGAKEAIFALLSESRGTRWKSTLREYRAPVRG